MAFGSAPLLVKVTMFLLMAGCLVHLIGFATSYWQKWTYDSSHYNNQYARLRQQVFRGRATRHSGLWSTCYEYEGSREVCGDTTGPSMFSFEIFDILNIEKRNA